MYPIVQSPQHAPPPPASGNLNICHSSLVTSTFEVVQILSRGMDNIHADFGVLRLFVVESYRQTCVKLMT